MRWDGRVPEITGRCGRTVLSRVALVGVVFLSLPGLAGAQEDYRSLDAGRPLRTTDAYPKKLFEWEIQMGGRGEFAEGTRAGAMPLALDVGALPNLELGLEVEPAFQDGEGLESAWGVEGVGLHGLYNFNQESWSWPALGMQAELEAPVGGDLSREGWGVSGRLLATRSYAGRFRIHVNGGYTAQESADGGDFWIGGVALDVPLGLSSRIFLADAFVEVPADEGPTRTWVEVGGRFQLSNWTVLDLGLATRLDEWANDRPHVEITVGLSRIFAIRRLTPSPEYADPAIR